MVGEPFFSRQLGAVMYRTGQGMGTYSSWTTMALTHHVIVRAAGVQAGHPDFMDYLILGDDVVIARKEVAEAYIKMMDGFGIQISIPKSVIRNDHHFGVEFASRLILGGGVDVSPLPIGLIFQPTVSRLFML